MQQQDHDRERLAALAAPGGRGGVPGDITRDPSQLDQHALRAVRAPRQGRALRPDRAGQVAQPGRLPRAGHDQAPTIGHESVQRRSAESGPGMPWTCNHRASRAEDARPPGTR